MDDFRVAIGRQLWEAIAWFSAEVGVEQTCTGQPLGPQRLPIHSRQVRLAGGATSRPSFPLDAFQDGEPKLRVRDNSEDLDGPK